MCGAMTHRGPDDEGRFVEGPVAIGMRRLSIIDIKGGGQPIFNEDESVAVVFNGEIYNFRELRRELESSGHVFRTNADTEVIVHAYEQHGLAAPRLFNGMFAAAVYDRRRRRLVLMRDHVGIKPLYVDFGGGALVFGSEVKVVLAAGMTKPDLDIDALGEFLAWEYVPGSRTLLKSVRKLLPAHVAVLDIDTWVYRDEQFWDVPDQGESEMDDFEWCAAVDEQIGRSVRSQLVSDVPLGAFLSGGVDSSLVAARMGEVKTFSIGFDDPSYNELAWSKKTAEHLGMPHITEVISPDVNDLFHRLMPHLDEPIGDFSIFPTYLVSRLARRDVTVALSGDGGDELFGGYETYAAQGIARRFADAGSFMAHKRALGRLQSLVPPGEAKKGMVNKAKRFMEGLANPVEMAHARWRVFMDSALRDRLFTPEAAGQMGAGIGAHVEELRRGAVADGRDWLNQCLYVDLKSYLCDNILLKVDRMSMAVSLEARVPLLDKDLVELAFQVPGRLKLRGGRTKDILKRIAARYVPRECVYRSKQGFSVPIKHWLRSSLRPLMEEQLAPARLASQGLFRPAAVGRLVDEHLRCRANHSHLLWTLIVFQAWHGMWMED
jgi:asparagine synthase (glutamine-hydrolysing)